MQHEQPDKLKLLIIEDDFLIAHSIQLAAQKLGIEVIGKAAKFEDAIAICEQRKPSFATMDVQLGSKTSGFDVARILEKKFDIPSLFISAYEADGSETCDLPQTCLGWIEKPFSAGQLKQRLLDVSVRL